MYANNVISENYSAIFLKDDSIIMNRMAILAAKIAYFNFEWRYVTLVLFSIFQRKGINSFLMNYNNTVALNTGQCELKYESQIPQFVIFCENFTEVIDTIDMLIKYKHNYSGKFIIICAQDNEKCDEEQVFKHLMRSLIINVVYLKPSNVNYEDPLVYSYRIVRPGKCFNSKPETLDVTINCENNACFKNLFPEKLSNFYGCPLFIASFPQPPFMYIEYDKRIISGKDGNIAKLLVDVLNATLVIRTPKEREWGQYKNNNWTGCLGEVFNNRVHLAMCNAPLTAYLYGNFQVSYPYYFMQVVWAAKKPPLLSSWPKLLHPFSRTLRLILIFIFLCIIFIHIFGRTKLYNKFRRTFHIKPAKRNYLFYAWLLFLGLPLVKMPSRNSVQIIILAWIWFTFIIRCAYQITLISSMKRNNYNFNLFTFQDILKYPFGGISSLREYFIEEKPFYDNWTTVDMRDVNNILDDIIEENTNFVLALSTDTIKFHVSRHNGTKLIQIFNDYIVNSPIVLYFKKYSPMSNPISKILNAAFERGFVQHSYQRNVRRQEHYLILHYIYNLEPLTMDNCIGCFLVMVVGWTISTIYFALEVVSSKLDKPTPNTQ